MKRIASLVLVGLLLAVATPAQAKSPNPCQEAKIAFQKWAELLKASSCEGAEDNTKARQAAWSRYVELRDACRALATTAPKCDPVACKPQPTPPPVVIEKPVRVEVVKEVIRTLPPPKPMTDFGDYRRFRVGLGLFGFGYVFQSSNPSFDIIGAWGWGPMLQLQGFATRNLELDLAIGIGLGLDKLESSPGRLRGYMAEGGALYWATRHVGLGLSARADLIGLKGANRDVLVIGGVPSVAFQGETGRARWKLELGVLGGVTYAEDTPGMALSVGPRATATVSF